MNSPEASTRFPGSSGAMDSRRVLVARVIASPVFAKSERLSSLLVYICDIALNGREAEISEQKIGTAVFGRSPDFDSSVDGIVRTQASRLRQRLDQYFVGQGAEEPVRIIIPKGGYVPFFVPQSVRETVPSVPMLPPVAPSAVSHEEPRKMRGKVPSGTLPWAFAAVLAATLLVVFLHYRSEPRKGQLGSEEPHPFWSQMFSRGRRTLIVPGDSGLVMLQGMTGKNVELEDYLSGEYRSHTLTAPRIDGIQDFGNRRYTSIVDLEAVHALTRISDRESGRTELRYARDLRPDDLKSGNVVLIGATEANPWVQLFERNMNFFFVQDRPHRIMSVVNRIPKPGEPKQWDSDFSDVQRRVYGVVAFVPLLTGDGNVLIVEGTSMAGTDSAWDFISDDSRLLPFLKQIDAKDGSLPHFEVVLGTNNFNGSAAKSSILAWRISK